MKLTNELIFIYQLFISCTKFGISDDKTIDTLNKIIVANDINHKLIDKNSLKELRRSTKRYLTEYKKLKVQNSCFNNKRMLGLIFALDHHERLNSIDYDTDRIIKKIFKQEELSTK